MRILICGGGTAGHVNPAFAIASIIKENNHNAKILFVGTKSGLEARLVPQEGYDIKYIDVNGIRRTFSLRNLIAFKKAWQAYRASKKIISEFKPDIVVGTGGYVSGPVIYAAQKMGIKTAIHEQNAFWGITTRLLMNKADKVMLSFEPDYNKLKRKDNIVITGNPVRSEVGRLDKQSARRVLGIDARPLILSCGGSLGAKKINDAVCEMLKTSDKEGLFYHIHGTGKRGYNTAKERLNEAGISFENGGIIRVSEYIYDMPRVMTASDLVICRAGAITLAELAVLGKPSILIPSPNVTENHQYYNAKIFEKKGAAIIIEDKDLNGKSLYRTIKKLFEDNSKLAKMSKSALELAKPDASNAIYKEIMSLL